MGPGRIAKRRRYSVKRTMRKGVRSGKGITTQFDRNTQYVKNRMPRYKRKQWVRFCRKVDAVISKKLGTRTVIFNDQLGVTIPNTAQQILTTCLYGFDGATDSATNCGSRDVLTILNNDPTITKTGTPPINPVNGKITFKSAIMDLTISNNPAEQNGPLEVDIYEIHHKKFIQNTTLQGSFVDGESNTTPISGAGVGVSLQVRGATPFDVPMTMSQDGLTIYKKTKYFIPVNGTVTYQIRDPRNIQLSADNLNGNSGFAWPGKTRSLLIVAKNVVGFNQASNSIAIGVTRKYSYVAESTSTTLDQVL